MINYPARIVDSVVSVMNMAQGMVQSVRCRCHASCFSISSSVASALVLLLLVLTCRVQADFYNVTNTDDSGKGSLRWAIQQANARPGFDYIRFHIPGNGIQHITPLTQLPEVTDKVFLDGNSQYFTGEPMIEIDAPAAANYERGLWISAGSSLVRGLIINGFQYNLYLSDAGGNSILGNWFGVKENGRENAPGPRYSEGIRISNSSNNHIGTMSHSQRNVFGSGFDYGIYLSDTSQRNTITNNYFGVAADAITVFANTGAYNIGSRGILTDDAGSNIIGGQVAQGGNIFAGLYEGIAIASSNNMVAGNFIGVNRSGELLGNGQAITVFSGAQNTIGGLTTSGANVIGGNYNGIYVRAAAHHNTIISNYIGVFPKTLAPISNASLAVQIAGSNNRVGSRVSVQANHIAYNGSSRYSGGVVVREGTGNSVYGNSIWQNTGNPIDLGRNGTDPLHFEQPGVGANNLQNYPLIQLKSVSGSFAVLAMVFHGKPRTLYRFDVYASHRCLANGFADAETPVGNFSFTTDLQGSISRNIVVKQPNYAGASYGATATDPSGNTSEVSPCSNIDLNKFLIYFDPPPKYGDYYLRGGLMGLDPAQYKIMTYIFVQGLGWYSKPTCNQLLIPVGSDNIWNTAIVTGGVDNTATKLAAFVVPASYTPSCLLGGADLPADVQSVALASQIASLPDPNQRHVSFSGLDWLVKSSSVRLGPGSNFFSADNENVSVDDQGRLHLKITYKNGHWNCGEIYLTQSLGFGTYKFFIDSPVENLDPNIVLGLFTWSDSAAYTHREIDIEFSRWGNANNPQNAQYVIQPFDFPGNLFRFIWPGGYPQSLHSFRWQPSSVYFRSVGLDISGEHPVQDWLFSNLAQIPPAGDEAPRINLWIFNGSAPMNGQEVEAVINRMEFIPD